ncbi:hypothetical protein [Paracoccus sp. SY]|uniref:hypothetical protein n=1 Tax=Paracoccus sp. SY TaxID=1330255 RepID=UPI000CD0EB0B|nr:hypothetical protein [Paracoccus sp. SY]
MARPLPAGLERRGRHVIVLHGAEETGKPARELPERLKQLLTGHEGVKNRRADIKSLLRQWYSAECYANAISLGIVAGPGIGTSAIRRIIIEGWKGKPVPGAIALLEHDRQLSETLVAMAAQSRNLQDSAAANRQKVTPLAPPSLMEWPPLVFFLSAEDPLRGECAQACRRMRAVGIPATLEIIDALALLDGLEPCGTGLSELVEELEHFFARHLVSDFPKIY